MPAYGRHPTSQYLRFGKWHFLIDCGEGTQARLSDFRIKRNKISHIFISHLHGDHVFGLAGLIGSFYHFNRSAPLHIFGPRGLEEMITTQLKLSGTHLDFQLRFSSVEPGEICSILCLPDVEVWAFPLNHRIPTMGYLFKQRFETRTLRIERANAYGITQDQFEKIKRGADGIGRDGRKIANIELTEAPPKALSYAFCSDTKYHPEIIDWIRNTNVLYHEATFEAQLEKKAQQTGHSTTLDAARIAKAANVDKLLIGHYSSRYKDVAFLEQEARQLFPNSFAVKEGEYYSLTDR